jgi:hypothetical protein
MAEDNDDIEVDGPEDVPPEEEGDEELEPISDKDGGQVSNTDLEDNAWTSSFVVSWPLGCNIEPYVVFDVRLEPRWFGCTYQTCLCSVYVSL